MLPKQLIPKGLYLWLQILGGFMCFHLNHVYINFTILLFAHENSLSNNIRYNWGWILKVLVWVNAHYVHPKKTYESPFLQSKSNDLKKKNI
jgi:hypothetical protein